MWQHVRCRLWSLRIADNWGAWGKPAQKTELQEVLQVRQTLSFTIAHCHALGQLALIPPDPWAPLKSISAIDPKGLFQGDQYCPPVPNGQAGGGGGEVMCRGCSVPANQDLSLGSLIRKWTALSCDKGWATDGKQSQGGGDEKRRIFKSLYLFQMYLIRAVYFFLDLGNERHICSKFCPYRHAVKLRWQSNTGRETDFLKEGLKEHLQGKHFLSSFRELWLCLGMYSNNCSWSSKSFTTCCSLVLCKCQWKTP